MRKKILFTAITLFLLANTKTFAQQLQRHKPVPEIALPQTKIILFTRKICTYRFLGIVVYAL